MATLYEQFLANSVRNIARPAFRHLGKDTNYGELRTTTAKLSYLYLNEIGHEARVILLARNSPAWIKTFFALTNIRAKVTPVDPDAPPADWLQAFKETDPTHIAITSDLLASVREFMSTERLILPVIEIEKKQGGEYDPSFSPPPEAKPVETDIILLLRSSGRTGTPKFAQFNHKHLHQAANALKSCYKAATTDRVLTTMSWAHPFAFVHGMLFPLMNGMEVVIDHGLQAVDFIDFLVEAKVTRLVGAPPFYHKLLVTYKNESRRPPTLLKSVTVGMAPLSPELKKVFQVLKIPAPHVYGMTESLWTLSMESIEAVSAEHGTHGRALPGYKYKVLDENGDVIEGADRRAGPLAISGPSVMQSYLGKEHEKDTKNALRGTWLYTGDYAELEGEENELKITFLGRKEDLLKRDGEFISLEPIEAVLRKLPGLQDAAAFVTKTSKNTPVPLCALVKIQGSNLTEKQAMEFCMNNLSVELHPAAVVFTDAIPRDSAGNVNYHRLRAQFLGVVG